MSKYLLSIFAMVTLTSSAMAVPFTADFETNQQSQFTVTSTTNDVSTSFTYDSSTHVQEGGDPVTIGPAPGSSSTNVLRLNANLASSTGVDAVSVYPTVAGLGSHWSMIWNCWQNYNGPALGGSGSTEMLIFGATNATSVAPVTETAPSIPGDGFYFTMSGEGGAAQDYRFYSGAGTIARNDAGATWHGGAFYNHLDQVWLDFFTTPPFETNGAMGKVWITIRLTVNGTQAMVAVKRPADADFVDVATATVPATATMPFIGYSDINTGFSSTPAQVASQFVLVDNLNIDNVASGVKDWSVY